MLIALGCVAVLITFAAAISDVRTRRIPNVLSVVLVLLGISVQAYAGGLRGAAVAVALVVIVLLAGSVAHARRWLGGGDIKLIASCIAFLGPHFAAYFLLFTAIAGGILAIVVAARERRVRAVFGNAAFGILYGRGQIPASVSSQRLPYAIAICSGMILTVIVRSLPYARLTL